MYGSLTATHSQFVANHASAGGAVAGDSATVQATGSIFSGNWASGGGGAILDFRGQVQLTDTTIADNTASGEGGPST